MRTTLVVITLAASLACTAAAGTRAEQILEASGIQGGVVVHLDCGDGRLTAALRANERFLVHGLDTDPADVAAARKHVHEQGLYGPVSIERFDGTRLPYVDRFVNLVVAESLGQVPMAEVMRVLAPRGVALVGGKKTVKPWPAGIDEWTHFLHDPTNNAVADDQEVGIPRSIQWVAEPRWGRTHEQFASMSAAVTAGGRIYYIADEAPLAYIRFMSDWKLIARDAFNGTLLWKRRIAPWIDHLRHFRSGPAHLPRRLVAVGDVVYVTDGLDGPVLKLDGATGEVLQTYEGTERTEEILFRDGVLYLVVGTSEAIRRGGGLHTRGEPEPTDYRYLAAVDAETGKTLWKKDLSDENILPLSLAVKDGRAYCQTTAAVVCMDAKSAKELWRTPRQTPRRRMGFSAPTLVAADGVVLCADRDAGKGAQHQPSDGTIEWGVHGWNAKGFARRTSSTLRAYDAQTGKELWATQCRENYNAPTDVFFIDGLVWVGMGFQGYDPRTGKQVRNINTKAPRVGMPHHRCYRNKASERFIFTGKSGVEVLSIEQSKWLCNNSWIRGTCQHGIVPANGLLYAPPDACACFLTVKVPGFYAAAPRRTKTPAMPLPDQPLLEKGPLYGKPQQAAAMPTDWPAYRHDAARSGAASCALPEAVAEAWSAKLGGRLAQPAVAGGRVYVASVDGHTLHALSAADGRELWRFTAGGRIDSTPTVHKGLALFGAADGWVYAVGAAEGRLAWRFCAAPQDRRVGVYGRLESIWPVHGAVLVQNDMVYVAAGRTSYTDGGIVLYRLDPGTGRQLSRTVLCHLDPKTGKQLTKEGGFNMKGTTNDVLIGDGERAYLKYFAFDSEGKRTDASQPHLYSITSLLVEEWFVRSYWMVGEGQPGAGWGGWANWANRYPSGRILAVADGTVYGYGRKGVRGGATGHQADAYHLFAVDTTATVTATDRRGRKKRQTRGKRLWSTDPALTVRALVAGQGRLAIAGPPDVGERKARLLAWTNPEEAIAAFRGDKGVRLRIVATADGKTLSETPLPVRPVFDGMAAAGGRLYLSCEDGTVRCLAGK
ncbi:MAG: PQQ-binding-like beta-propeller repeat protein [Planctomycetota bacterium]